jgi:hypothetical protein
MPVGVPKTAALIRSRGGGHVARRGRVVATVALLGLALGCNELIGLERGEPIGAPSGGTSTGVGGAGGSGGSVGCPSGCNEVDVLVAIDTSKSMAEEIGSFRSRQVELIAPAVSALASINGGCTRYRIAVTDEKDSGFRVPPAWIADTPWFDSTALTEAQIVAAIDAVVALPALSEPPLGCEHVLSSATERLVADDTGFVRPGALLVLLLMSDVDDYGAYDQATGNTCMIGCATKPELDPREALLKLLALKGSAAVVALVVAGDPIVDGGKNACGQPASCGCEGGGGGGGGGDCGRAFHADRLSQFADLAPYSKFVDICQAPGKIAAEIVWAIASTVDEACRAMTRSQP